MSDRAIGRESDSQVPLGRKDRIDILLAYYDTLRWDIHVRTAGIYTLAAALTVVLTLIPAAVSSPNVLVVTGVALAVVAFVFAHFFFRINRDIAKAAEKLRRLERTINELAGGQELLDWETRYGGMTTGFIGMGKPKLVDTKPS